MNLKQETNKAFTYKDGYFTIDDKPFLYYSGEIHYSRIPKELWEDRLQKIKGAFFNSVGVYSFWNWHEPEKGKLDLTDLKDIILLTQKVGLKYFVRPGTYCCAEWDMGGYPKWLLPEQIPFRTLTKKYLKIFRHWHRKIIELFKENDLFYPNGPIILYQIENEYFWTFDRYLATLYKIVHDLDIPVPIITNENFSCAKTTPILHAIDLYPAPWELLQPILWMIKYQNQSEERPKFSAELEGGWFSSYGKGLPTLRGSFPVEWTDFLARTLIAQGLNGINFYMIHGGTNFGYWGGGGNARITTTYDYEACIREWGELYERYYRLKLLGAFLDTTGSQLVQAKPQNNLELALVGNLFRKIGLFNNLLGLKKYLRKKDDLKFWFLSNLTKKSKNVKFKLKTEDLSITTKVNVDPRTIKIVPENFEKNGIMIRHITSHLFHIDDQGSRTILICYEKEGSTSEIALKVEGSPDVEGAEHFQYVGTTLILTVKHSFGQIVKVKTPKPLYIFPISTETAKRTWYIDGMPVLSDIYFAYSDGSALDCEVDAPNAWLNFIFPEEIKISYQNQSIGIYNPQTGITEVKLADLIPEEPEITLKSIHTITDCAESDPKFNDAVWRDIPQIQPLEDLGIFENGFTWYRSTFIPTSERVILEVGARDYVQVFVNGKFLGTKWWSRSINISNFIQKDKPNSIVILVENTGNRHHFPFERGGLIYPPLLHASAKKSVFLKFRFIRNWDEKRIPRRTYSPFLLPARAIQTKLPTDIENITISESLGHLQMITPYAPTGSLFYKAGFKQKLDLGNKEVWIQISNLGQDGFFWLNNKLVKRFINNIGPNGLNITPYLKPGKNNLLFAETIRGGNTLLEGVSIITGSSINNWRVQHELSGQVHQYFRQSCNLDHWETVQFPYQQKSLIQWYKFKFSIQLPTDSECPLKFTVPNLPGMALIYFNETLIGRYEEIGPQHDFFIPPGLIQNGADNDVTITINAHKLNTKIPEGFTITPYLNHKKVKLFYSKL